MRIALEQFNLFHLISTKQFILICIFRATLSSSAVLIGFALPSIGSLIALIGAFGFSTTGLLFPVSVV